jgi:hypothetical protein
MATRRRRRARQKSAGLREALRALRLAKRAPTESDAPRPSTFPGRKMKPLPGQLDLDGNEVER